MSELKNQVAILDPDVLPQGHNATEAPLFQHVSFGNYDDTPWDVISGITPQDAAITPIPAWAERLLIPKEVSKLDMGAFNKEGFEPLRILGHGSEAVAILAWSERNGQLVCIKKDATKSLFADDRMTEHEDRFLTQARVLRQLNHPNIEKIFEVVKIGKDICLVEPAIIEINNLFSDQHRVGHTSDFSGFVAQNRNDLPAEQALQANIEAFSQLCEGVEHAHVHDVIHRDIKPQNVLVSNTGEPILIDFAFAWDRRSNASGEEPPSCGTAGYTAPEAMGNSEPLPQHDIYSLGAVLYEALTGRRPYFEVVDSNPHNVAVALSCAVLTEDPTAPTEVDPAVPKALEQVCQKAMASDPLDRYNSVAELLEDLLNSYQPLELKKVAA